MVKTIVAFGNIFGSIKKKLKYLTQWPNIAGVSETNLKYKEIIFHS